ncbi:cadherin-like domain-containing protein [Vibrio chagasii]|nr:cadherin-like domain-containing protein [Vibrio chagasii]
MAQLPSLKEDLLANATDVDGDNLEAVNLSTNDQTLSSWKTQTAASRSHQAKTSLVRLSYTYDVTDAIETVAADLNLTVNPINDAPDVPDMSF